MKHWLLQNGTFVKGDQLETGDLLIQDGRIAAFFSHVGGDATSASITEQAVHVTTIDCTGALIGPGFIDLHVHGGGGSDVMDATVEAFEQMARTHGQCGTTRFLLTTVTGSDEHLLKVCRTANTWRRQLADGTSRHNAALPLGIHLEGPYIAPTKKGAQNGDFIRPFSRDEFRAYQEVSEHFVKLITLAPETLPDQRMITQLREQGVVVSIGHTEATYEQVHTAVQHGASHFTHLCNAMPSVHHRAPGPITYALTHDGVTAELIPDGLHVHPAIIQLALRAKQPAEVAIVTDAIRALGLGDCEVDVGGLQVFVKEGKAVLADGTLAGSCLDMETAYRFLQEKLALGPVQLFRMMSTNPARILGVDNHLGSLETGKRADLVIFRDNQLTDVMVEGTWIKGGVTA